MANRFKFRYVNELSGTIVILVVALVVVSLFLAARAQRWLEPKIIVRTLLPEEGSYGLREGADVEVLGTLAGEVREITITETGRIEAELRMRSDFFRFVREDSVAIIRKRIGLLAGDVYLNITRGKGRPLPRKNARIACTAQESVIVLMRETLGQLRKSILPTIQEYAKLASDLQNPDGSFQLLLGRMNRIAERLEEGEGVAAKLLTDTSLGEDLGKIVAGINTSLGQLQAVLKDTQELTGKMGNMTDAVREELAAVPQVASETKKALRDVQVVLGDVHKTMERFPNILQRLDREMETLPALVLQTKDTLREIERLVLGMQRHWLLREYIDRGGPTTRIPPGEVSTER